MRRSGCFSVCNASWSSQFVAWMWAGRQNLLMPTFGKRWRHVIVNTRCSWLHGDLRGFRNRKHRIHSSGDYRSPPPPEEHAGLRKYHQRRSGEPIRIPPPARGRAGLAFVRRLRKEEHRVLAVAVSGEHLHALVELPDDPAQIRLIIGRCKCAATEAMKPALSGRVWAEGGEFKPVDERDYERNVYGYILTKQGRTAWTWSFRDELGLPRFPEGSGQRVATSRRRIRGTRSGPSHSSGRGVSA
jgi:hypothetical protein